MIKITLRKSPIGYSEKQRRTLTALGLRRLNSSTIKPDNPQIRGMVKRVIHLVEVEPVENDAVGGKESETK
ncbi:MAG: 50S ribosomal protein L30 [Armatimonadetes bacterium]|nr:50S ribosomal protein L30 [Armatimonadota bacterium]